MAYLYLARELCITSKTGPCFGLFHCCQSLYASVAVSLASRTNSFQPGIVFLLLELEFFWPMLALTALVRQEITCMIVLHYECILCTKFALMFMLFYYVHQQKYVFLSICPKVLLESHPEHRPSLHVYPTAFASTKLYCYVTEAMDCLKVSIYSSPVTQS